MRIGHDLVHIDSQAGFKRQLILLLGVWSRVHRSPDYVVYFCTQILVKCKNAWKRWRKPSQSALNPRKRLRYHFDRKLC